MVKNLIIKPINSKAANAIVKKYHYSGKVCQNSQIHFGIFLKNVLVGAAQFGPSTDKRRMGQNLNIGMNEFLELNRLAISDVCGKNTESRVLGLCLRFLKKKYPFLRCIISFADACQCGDGTIYRAANFKLHSYKKNASLYKLNEEAILYFRKYIPSCSDVVAIKTFDNYKDEKGKYLKSHLKKFNCKPLMGYQMKYIYYYDKKLEKAHPSIPFDKIPQKLKMYKGLKRIEHEGNAASNQDAESGSTPTGALQSKGFENV